MVKKDKNTTKEIEIDFNEVNPDFTSINGIKINHQDFKEGVAEKSSGQESDEKTHVSINISMTGLYLYQVEKKENIPLVKDIKLGCGEDQNDFIHLYCDENEDHFRLSCLDQTTEVLLNGAYFLDGCKLNLEDLIEVHYVTPAGVEKKFRYIFNDNSKFKEIDANKIIARDYLSTDKESQTKIVEQLEGHISQLKSEISKEEQCIYESEQTLAKWNDIKEKREEIIKRISLHQQKIEELKQKEQLADQKMASVDPLAKQQQIEESKESIKKVEHQIRAVKKQKHKVLEKIQSIEQRKKQRKEQVAQQLSEEEQKLKEQLKKIEEEKKKLAS